MNVVKKAMKKARRRFLSSSLVGAFAATVGMVLPKSAHASGCSGYENLPACEFPNPNEDQIQHCCGNYYHLWRYRLRDCTGCGPSGLCVFSSVDLGESASCH